jgi:DNA-directed RNA polymerase subunit M/transcription elongation factor TFIIS
MDFIALFPHQENAISQMIDLEMKAKERNETLIAKLQDPVGAGKTAELLNLVARTRNEIWEPRNFTISNVSDVTKVFTFKRATTATLIIVKPPVFIQWMEEIKKFTNLKVLPIIDLRQLRKLINQKKLRSYLNTFDVVLAKSGKITKPLETNNCFQTKLIPNILMSFGFQWKRVIFDDFNTPRIQPGLHLPRGITNWFASATMERRLHTQITPAFEPPLTEEFLLQAHVVANSEEEVKASINLIKFKLNMVVFTDPNQEIISAIRSFNPDIMEMVNAGAFQEIGRQLSKPIGSINDLFFELLNRNKEIFEGDQEHLEFLRKLEDGFENGEIKLSDDPDAPAYSKKDFINQTQPDGFNRAKFGSFIASTKARLSLTMTKFQNSVARIKENLNSECPICMDAVSDAFVIVKCCSNLFCYECGSNMFYQKIRRREAARCPMCRAEIGENNLSTLNSKVTAELLENSNIEEFVPVTEEEQHLPAEKMTRLEVIKKIIDGDHADLPIVHTSDQEEIEERNRKVLVFSNYSSSFREISEKIQELETKTFILCGTPKQIRDTTREFEESEEPCIMFVNGMKYCQGINLQSTTDVIIAHKCNREIMVQAVGRAQRIGRKTRLNVWLVFNQDENDH